MLVIDTQFYISSNIAEKRANQHHAEAAVDKIRARQPLGPAPFPGSLIRCSVLHVRNTTGRGRHVQVGNDENGPFGS